MAAYLIKPVKQSSLLDAIMTALGRAEGASQDPLITRHTLRESRKRLRILLAEDNAVNRTLAVRLLEKAGHTVAVAVNGREAVDAVRAERPDLVLMDVQMPVMGGFEATARIRADERGSGRRLPIIAMTAHALKGDRERCLASGMDDYISKPVKPEALLSTIDRFFAAAPDPAKSAAPAAAPAEPSLLDTLVSGDPGLLTELVGLFLEEYPALVEQIRTSIQTKDHKVLYAAAHQMSGMIANFGAHKARELSKSLQALAETEDLAGAPEMFAELEAEIATVRADLERRCAAVAPS